MRRLLKSVFIFGVIILTINFWPKHEFKNQLLYTPHTMWSIIKWKLTSKAASWPEWIESPYHPLPPSPSDHKGLSATFINHSTFLLQHNGLTILTDPIWSERTSPVSFAGPKRVRNPGVKFEDLTRVDVVMISHDHYDHLDKDTLKKLAEKFQPIILVGMNNGELVKSLGFKNVVEMNWWDSKKIGDLTFHFVPSQHFSGRGLFDRMTTLWGGFVIESKFGNIYFAGDTAVGPHDKQLFDKFKSFRLSLIPIGAYKPKWVMQCSHVDPHEAVELHKTICSNLTIGMHFGTFQLSDEEIDAPLKDLEISKKELGVESSKFITLEFGQTKWVD